MFDQMIEGLRGVFFPRVCLSCSSGIPGSAKLLCPSCATTRFEDPNPQRFSSPDGVLLPESVQFFDSMWIFDTSGGLRDMLHALKYDGLVTLGHELGELLHDRVFASRWEHADWTPKGTVLLPVPMHRLRVRARGYNQAREIAFGFSQRSGIPILGEADVQRVRYTKSQTGFSQSKRVKNIRGVFSVVNSGCVEGRKVIIIDDVFTTGSTTFELATTLHAAGSKAIGILTVAAT